MREMYLEDDGIKLHVKLEKPSQFESHEFISDLSEKKYPLVIIIHGLSGHMEEKHIVAVSQTVRRIGMMSLRVDLYGHGKSGGEFERHTLFKWLSNINLIVDWAKKLPMVSEIYLAGHSQGGLLVMLLAGMRPDDFKAIIPMSPAICITDGARSGSVLGMSFDPLRIPDAISYLEYKLCSSYFRAAQMLYVDPAIDRYRKPVLIVHSNADEAVPIKDSIMAAKRYENCRMATIPGDTHCFDIHLDRVQITLRNFLMIQKTNN